MNAFVAIVTGRPGASVQRPGRKREREHSTQSVSLRRISIE